MKNLEFLKSEMRKSVASLPGCADIDFSQYTELGLYSSGFVGSFKPLKDEPHIKLDDHLKICWPVVEGSEMNFHTASEFEESELGFLQPVKGSSKIQKSEITLIFVPGQAFDFYGDRLGRGKGFYDKYLENFSGIKVGVCHSQRFVNEPLPNNDQRDQKVDYVLTEKFLYQVNQKKRY